MGVKKTTKTKRDTEELLCPIRYMLTVFGGKWKLPIICLLSNGMPTRYSMLKKKLGDITNVMLSQSLKELEAEKIVHRKQYNEVPPRVEYTLSEKGKSILPALGQLGEWAKENMQSKHGDEFHCESCNSDR